MAGIVFLVKPQVAASNTSAELISVLHLEVPRHTHTILRAACAKKDMRHRLDTARLFLDPLALTK